MLVIILMLSACGVLNEDYHESSVDTETLYTSAPLAQTTAPSQTLSNEPNYHPFSIALSDFFTDLVPPPTNREDFWHFMPCYSHAMMVDLDGYGNLGVVATRWRANPQSQFAPYLLEQYLFWLYEDELHKGRLSFEKFGVTASDRLVVTDEIGACNITLYTYALLGFYGNELMRIKTFTIRQSWALGWMLGDYDDPDYMHFFGTYYYMRTHAAQQWNTHVSNWTETELTYEEFTSIMVQYSLHNITANIWELPDQTEEILIMLND